VFFSERFRGFSLYNLLGDICMNPLWSFPFDSHLKSVRKGARFWGLCCSRVCGVLFGNPPFPLDSTSFGGPQLGYGVPMRCCY
jgi:hypothetical protein